MRLVLCSVSSSYDESWISKVLYSEEQFECFFCNISEILENYLDFQKKILRMKLPICIFTCPNQYFQGKDLRPKFERPFWEFEGKKTSRVIKTEIYVYTELFYEKNVGNIEI